jgi:hypothetical protein
MNGFSCVAAGEPDPDEAPSEYWPVSAAVVDAIERMLADGWSIGEVAASVGVTAHVVAVVAMDLASGERPAVDPDPDRIPGGQDAVHHLTVANAALGPGERRVEPYQCSGCHRRIVVRPCRACATRRAIAEASERRPYRNAILRSEDIMVR